MIYRGLTLIELMICMAILTTVMAMVAMTVNPANRAVAIGGTFASARATGDETLSKLVSELQGSKILYCPDYSQCAAAGNRRLRYQVPASINAGTGFPINAASPMEILWGVQGGPNSGASIGSSSYYELTLETQRTVSETALRSNLDRDNDINDNIDTGVLIRKRFINSVEVDRETFGLGQSSEAIEIDLFMTRGDIDNDGTIENIAGTTKANTLFPFEVKRDDNNDITRVSISLWLVARALSGESMLDPIGATIQLRNSQE